MWVPVYLNFVYEDKKEKPQEIVVREITSAKTVSQSSALSPCIILIAIYLKIKDSFSSACQPKDSKEWLLYLTKEVTERATNCAVI